MVLDKVLSPSLEGFLRLASLPGKSFSRRFPSEEEQEEEEERRGDPSDLARSDMTISRKRETESHTHKKLAYMSLDHICVCTITLKSNSDPEVRHTRQISLERAGWPKGERW